jgi:hypothetical protein
MPVSECVLNIVFRRAKNGPAERASPTLSWQILKQGHLVMLILCPE